MFRRLLEAFFRHKILLLLPPVLIPAVVTSLVLYSTPPVYETMVSVWADRPAYLNMNDGSNSWLTPVQSQTGRLNELLRTRAFLTDVAQRTTTLAPLVGTVAGQTRLADLVGRSVTIGSGGTAAGAGEHLLLIRVQATTPQLAYELCKAIIDAYQEKTAADQTDQASLAVDFYQAQLKDAQTQLNKASQDLRRYALARQQNADGNSLDPSDTSIPAAMLDPRLGALQANVQTAQLNVNNAQGALKQAQQEAQMAAQGQQYGFQVLDPPLQPTQPTSQLKKILVYPIAAVVAGLGLSALLLVILVASDRSVRAEGDLAAGLRPLGTVPRLQLRSAPKKLRGIATRRAIGAMAGMALPAAGARS